MSDTDPTTPTASADGAVSAPDPATAGPAPSPLAAVGLEPGFRYRCESCGNLTRFDVAVSERVSRYWHVTVGGEGTIEQTDVAEQHIESITCRWCGSDDRIVTEPAPSA